MVGLIQILLYYVFPKYVHLTSKYLYTHVSTGPRQHTYIILGRCGQVILILSVFVGMICIMYGYFFIAV